MQTCTNGSAPLNKVTTKARIETYLNNWHNFKISVRTDNVPLKIDNFAIIASFNNESACKLINRIHVPGLHLLILSLKGSVLRTHMLSIYLLSGWRYLLQRFYSVC